MKSSELLGDDLNNYSHIELTEEETAEALRVGRHAKQIRINIENYNREMSKPIEWLNYTAEELFKLMVEATTYKGQNFILECKQGEEETEESFSDRNKKIEKYVRIAKNLCCYFSGDERFKGDLKKGLALVGPAGTGKTALMKFFTSNQMFSYRIKSMLEITADYKQNGEGAAMFYNGNPQGSRNDYGHTIYGYCFDDVGMEEIPAKYYGATKNVFAEVILMRDLNVPLNSTHITSNIPPPKMEELYGSRVYDRMKDMFNIISFEGLDSFRGK